MVITHTKRKHTLHTKRVYLRAAQEGDLDDMFEMFKDGEVMRYWYILQPFAVTSFSQLEWLYHLMLIKPQVMPTTHPEIPNGRISPKHARLSHQRRPRFYNRPLQSQLFPSSSQSHWQSWHLGSLQLRDRISPPPLLLGPRLHDRGVKRALTVPLGARDRKDCSRCGSEE